MINAYGLKTYIGKDGQIDAVDGVDLTIEAQNSSRLWGAPVPEKVR